jgi:hypothetical protein
MKQFKLNFNILSTGLGLAGFLTILPGTLSAQEQKPANPAQSDTGSVTTAVSIRTAAVSADPDTVPAAETPKKETNVTPEASPASQPAKVKSFLSSLSFGGDIYYGGTNATGIRARNNDGVWAGFGPAYPSNVSLNWKEGDARAVRVSLGIGDLYTASGTTLRQPVEAYYQLPAGKGSLTIGKYYVPFAAQEWEYEPKYGLMYTTASGSMTYVTSLNYNFNRNTPNLYFRAGKQFTKRTSLGMSLGGGRGLFTDTNHGMALGLDLSHDMGGVLLTSEYDLAVGPSGPFHFLYAKATLTRLGSFAPYAGFYYWHDEAHELGNFNSLLLGMSYKLTRNLALEGGYARGKERNILWFQSHTTF